MRAEFATQSPKLFGIKGLYLSAALVLGCVFTAVVVSYGYYFDGDWSLEWLSTSPINILAMALAAIASNLLVAFGFRRWIACQQNSILAVALSIVIGYVNIFIFSSLLMLNPMAAFYGLIYGVKYAPDVIPLCLAAFVLMRIADRFDRKSFGGGANA